LSVLGSGCPPPPDGTISIPAPAAAGLTAPPKRPAGVDENVKPSIAVVGEWVWYSGVEWCLVV
jgi:hypothetical protein